MAFEEMKQAQAKIWSMGKFELMAETLAPVHEDLVGRLGVNEGERWLDVATGTGAVAMLAARRGADVSAQDLSPGLIETARRLAAADGLEIDFSIGDCEQMPFEDRSFDAVSSGQGAIFGPDHKAVAGELTRLCRPGGRVGLTAWRPGGSIERSFAMLGRFGPPPPEGAGNPFDWGRREYVRETLGDAFELEFHDGDSPQRADSPEALWELFTVAMGPIKMLLASSDEARIKEVHDAFIEFYSQFVIDDGTVRQPREYVVIVGRRM